MSNPAQGNAPVTGASITAAIGACLVAFTTLTAAQTTAVLGIVGIVAQVLVQRFHTDPKGTP
jgi:hypothetical protein